MYSLLFCPAYRLANPAQVIFYAACGHALQADSSFFSGWLAPDHLLKQRYHIMSQVGKGGFGAVYKAADTEFGNRLVALKEMSQSGLSPQEIHHAAEAFKHEALMLAGLTHPNLPRIYDHFYDAGHWYLVMDFIEGLTLEQYLNRLRTRHLPLEQALDIGIQLCRVLGYLHTRHPPIIFRDLKLTNIMLTPDGDVYLVDFGIARHFKPGQVKDTMALGSLGYAAPEQYGRSQTTPSADIYSLGAILHQLLTGNDPQSNTPNAFHFPPLHLHGQPTPAGLQELIAQMLEMDPKNRPASMVEVRQELQRIAAEETTRHAAAVQHTVSPNSYHHSVVSRSPTSVAQPRQVRRLSHAGTILCRYEGHWRYHGHPHEVTAITWSPDGTRIASASIDSTVQVWDAVTGHTILIYHGHSGTQTLPVAVAWSPDGSFIASGGGGVDKTVQVWNAATGGYIGTYHGHAKQVNAVAWNPVWGTGILSGGQVMPDGTYVASASHDGTVHVWDAMALVNAAPTVAVLKYHGHASFWRRSNIVNAVAWSPDGSFIASAGADKTVQIWDAATGEHILTYRGHTYPVYTLSWSPDGTLIASGGGDDTVQVWDAARGELVFTYHGHSGPQMWVNAVAWSPDGTRIASGGGGDDSTVQVWDALDGGNAFTYNGHADFVNAVVWSRDGTLIASASHDGTVQVWQGV